MKGAQVAQGAYLLAAPQMFSEPPPSLEPQAEHSATQESAPEFDWSAACAEAQALLDGASGDARALIDGARAQAAQLVDAANARVGEIERQARDEGHAQGLAGGRSAAQSEMEEMLSTMRGLIEMARVERHKIIASAEPEIVRLATAIAERILHARVSLEPPAVLDMTRAALTRLVNRETITVRVNPADIETMRENRETMMSMNDIEHLRVVADQRVDRGGVVIETEAGTIDAKVSTQLREVRRLLHVEDALTVAPTSRETLLTPSAQAS